MLLNQIADAALQQSPDKTAILCGSQRLTYSMFVAAADHLAADLVGRGCRHGDRVALWLPNCAEALVAYFACFRAGFIAVALDFRYRPDEVTYCLERAGATVIVTLGETWRALVGARHLANVREVLCVDENDWLSTILRQRRRVRRERKEIEMLDAGAKSRARAFDATPRLRNASGVENL